MMVIIAACSECEALARRAKQEFVDFKYFKTYERDYKDTPEVNWIEKAGKKYCE